MSSRSRRLRAGSITVVMPARSAASTFSLTPPIGSTRPRRLISPVIATSLRTGRSRQQRRQRDEHRDAGARAVLRRRAGRHVDVDVGLLEQLSVAMPSGAARALTSESAACALSFITSPSWPVRMSLPLPGMRAASMKRMSPPTGVHARPVATPGMPAAHRDLGLEALRRRGSRAGRRRSIVMRSTLPSAMRTATLRQHVADLALEVAHARLARVVVDDRHQRVVADLALLGA